MGGGVLEDIRNRTLDWSLPDGRYAVPQPCPICGGSLFASARSLETHIRGRHSEKGDRERSEAVERAGLLSRRQALAIIEGK